MPPGAWAIAAVLDQLADLLETLRIVHAFDFHPPDKLHRRQAAYHQQHQAGHERAALKQAVGKARQAAFAAPGDMAGQLRRSLSEQAFLVHGNAASDGQPIYPADMPERNARTFQLG